MPHNITCLEEDSYKSLALPSKDYAIRGVPDWMTWMWFKHSSRIGIMKLHIFSFAFGCSCEDGRLGVAKETDCLRELSI